jgi:hypothetical protein
MSTGYLLVLKNKNIFNSQINRIIMFKSFDVAYEYGKNLEPFMKKEIVYTQEEAEKNNVIWITSKNNYPQITCKIYPISNDTALNIYLTINESEKNIVQFLYKNLKINNIILTKKLN